MSEVPEAGGIRRGRTARSLRAALPWIGVTRTGARLLRLVQRLLDSALPRKATKAPFAKVLGRVTLWAG